MIQFPVLEINGKHDPVFIQNHDASAVCSSGPREGMVMEGPLLWRSR